MDGLGGHYDMSNKGKYCLISHVASKKHNKPVNITTTKKADSQI